MGVSVLLRLFISSYEDCNTIYTLLRIEFEVKVSQAAPLLESGYTQRTVAESFDMSRNVVLLPGCRCATRRWAGKGKVDTTCHHKVKIDIFKIRISLQNWQYMARRLQMEFQHATGQQISKQYITSYMLTRGQDIQQVGLISPGKVIHGNMSLLKSIRTGNCKTGTQFCSWMKADFT